MKPLRRRLQPAERHKLIIAAALTLAKRDGFGRLSRAGVAREAGVVPGLVAYHCGTLVQLKRAVMRAAIQQNALEVIAQGLAVGDRVALKAPPEVKANAAALLAAR